MSTDLYYAVTHLLADAQAAFTVSDEPADIKRSTDLLRTLLRTWQDHNERVVMTVVGLLRIVQARCAHDGAERGANDRDGAWMAPCPTCGASK